MNGLKEKIQNAKSQKGFTIIEVVLVLAIAGLIFLMVFIALPALQRNQRDTQRKNDMGRLSTAIVNYTNSNRGKLPASDNAGYASFVNSYLVTGGDTFIDPSGARTSGTGAQPSDQATYALTINTDATLSKTFSDSQNVIYVSPTFICADSSDSIVAGGTRKVAFRMVLESGGYYCVNN